MLQLSSLPHYLWAPGLCQYGSQRRASIGRSPLRSTAATDDALVVIVAFTVEMILNIRLHPEKLHQTQYNHSRGSSLSSPLGSSSLSDPSCPLDRFGLPSPGPSDLTLEYVWYIRLVHQCVKPSHHFNRSRFSYPFCHPFFPVTLVIPIIIPKLQKEFPVYLIISMLISFIKDVSRLKYTFLLPSLSSNGIQFENEYTFKRAGVRVLS